jgi:hypothetical protein
MNENIIIYEKNSGRPLRLTEQSAQRLLNSGAFLSLSAHINHKGVNTDGRKRIHIPTERHEIEEKNVSDEVCDVDCNTGCQSTEAKHHSECISHGEEKDLTQVKRSRGRPKVIKDDL